jgi:hypothetical protein
MVAMGRQVLSDVVVIFGPEQSLERNCPSRLSEKTEQLRALLLERAAILDANQLSRTPLEENADYEPQARALSTYFPMSLPGAIPDHAVRKG